MVSGGATMWFPKGGHLQWINDDRDDDDSDDDDENDDNNGDENDDDENENDGAVSLYKPLYPQ